MELFIFFAVLFCCFALAKICDELIAIRNILVDRKKENDSE